MEHAHTKLTEALVWQWLEEVKDPEIPVLSLVDLGVITELTLSGNHVKVEMTPTFVGCPALDYMKKEIIEVLKGITCKQRLLLLFVNPGVRIELQKKGKRHSRNLDLLLLPPANYSQTLKYLKMLNARVAMA